MVGGTVPDAGSSPAHSTNGALRVKLTPETEARIRLGERLKCGCGRVLKVGKVGWTGRFANIVDCENRCVTFAKAHSR